MRCLLALLVLATTSASETPDVFAQQRSLGRGVNLGNALDAPTEGAWGWKIADEDLSRIRAAGFDSVRIPVRWSAHAATNAPYTIEPAFLDRVEHVVRRALEQRLSVVLNMHHYEAFDAEPAGQRARFVALWRQIAQRFAGYPDALHFELYNEPHGGLTAKEWNLAWPPALAEVRRLHPNRAVHIGGVQWNQASTLQQLALPAEDRHIIGHVHCYEPFHFTHQGAQWVNGADAWIGTRWQGTPEEQTRLRRAVFASALEWSRLERRPIYLGEFGAYGQHARLEDRVRWTRFMAQSAADLGMSTAYWEYCQGFGLYDPEAKAWRQPLLDAALGR
ncbi:MAG: glycoside hydrolase family 5 protein [Opitutales bacterium]